MADISFNGAGSDWLQIAQAAYSQSTDYLNAGIRNDIEQDIRQFQGVHPKGSKYLADVNRSRSRFFRPKTRSAIRKNEAVAASALFSNSEVVEITPWDDSDYMQQCSASLAKELLNFRLKRTIPWFLLSMGSYQDAQTVGLCCSHQYWRYDKRKRLDEPACDLVPIENVRFDPSSTWYDVVNTSPYFIHLMPMYVKDVQARMKQTDPKTGAAKWMALTPAQILQGVKGYSDSIRLQREQGRSDPQAMATSLNPYQLVWVHRNIAEVDGIDYMWYTLGDTALLSKGEPLEKTYWHGRRPYVIGYAMIESHKVYPGGVSRLTRDVQGELNENANQRLDNVKLAMDKRFFVKRGTQTDLRSLTRGSARSVTLMGDPEKDVKVLETKDVTHSAYEEQDRLNADFDELSGNFGQSSVQGNKQLSDKLGGMEILSEDASQVGGYQLRTWVTTWAEPVLYQLMLLEQHYETDENILRMCGKKADLGQDKGPVEITDKMIMQDLALVVHVGIGATTPKSQLENFLYALRMIVEILKDGTLEKYDVKPEEVINEVFGKLGYKSADRFFDWDSQDPLVNSLKMQVKQLQQALDAKENPQIIAGKVAKLGAEVRNINARTVESGVTAAFAAMEAGEVIAAVPAVAPIADEVMKAAGYVPPTPPGVDPGFDGGQMQAPAPGIHVKAVNNPHTGVGFTPGAANPVEQGRMLPKGMAESTHPLFPKKPGTPDIGAHAGVSSVAQLKT